VLKSSRVVLIFLLISAAVLIGVLWRRNNRSLENKGAKTALLTELPPCRIALTPTSGYQPIDAEIARLRKQILNSSAPRPAIEKLGWLLVKKARTTFDNGYYKLAEQCAACLDATGPKSPEALLLRAHVLQSVHRFTDAESIARELLKTRERPFDYGVLGDVLIDQGKVREGVVAYQKMVDLRPDLQSYTRAAHVRWLTGDLAGARELMRLATSSSSPNDPEAGAWAYTRLALYQLQEGQTGEALQSCNAALSLQSDYAPALFVRGRVLLFSNARADAFSDLNQAVSLNPLVEYEWTLADALRESGDTARAAILEAQITSRGATEDRRTLSLYLATRHENSDLAVQLAEQELSNRQDIFTHDAVAWSMCAAGRKQEARQHMAQALAEGTHDARLFFHAGVIAALNDENQQAIKWLERADRIKQMLLPSERVSLGEWLMKVRTRGNNLNRRS
jgi:tetratricopeptide (TPR) repeat protein